MRVAALALFCVARVSLAQVPAPGDDWAVPRVPASDRASTLPNSPVLIKALGDAAEFVLRWRPPVSAGEWAARRPAVELAFRKAIGLEKLPERTPLNAHIVSRHEANDYVIENLIFESRPGFPVTANIYRPRAPSQTRRPAVLNPIGHYLGPGKTHPEVQARCIKLARMGFIVLVYDAIGQGERMVHGNVHHDAGYALLPLGQTIAGWMVWDSMRALDYLLAQSDVDPSRIGLTGNSGGGLNTLFTAALDSRITAAVVSGFTFDFNQWIKYAGAHCTCTHLPGLFAGMEWFEIAGLIAPRPLMLLQGSNDNIFPIEGARRAGHKTAKVFTVIGKPENIAFRELEGQVHAYSRPYREAMYGWLARHLLRQGDGSPIPEGDLSTLPEYDARLLCDPKREVMGKAPSVLDFARREALEASDRLVRSPAPSTDAVRAWIRDLTAPPEAAAHYMAVNAARKTTMWGAAFERVSFLSEEGQNIAALLWVPEQNASQSKTVIFADERGKEAVAKSGMVQPLLQRGFTVLAVDLRGRGESLSQYRPTWDINFRLVKTQNLMGRPLAGRRAFDLTRAVDYLARRRLAGNQVTIVGLGSDSLSALLAAASDDRMIQVAVADYVHSFATQMVHMPRELPRAWNDPQLRGRLKTGEYEVDFGAVIPSALLHADIPQLATLLAPRRVLFCQARDQSRVPEDLKSSFRRVANAAGQDWIRYEPDRSLDAAVLLDWLR